MHIVINFSSQRHMRNIAFCIMFNVFIVTLQYQYVHMLILNNLNIIDDKLNNQSVYVMFYVEIRYIFLEKQQNLGVMNNIFHMSFIGKMSKFCSMHSFPFTLIDKVYHHQKGSTPS